MSMSQYFMRQSILETIKERSGRITGAIYEIRSIVEDIRMQYIGGLDPAFVLWDLVLIPSLLNNAESWIELDKEAEDQLDELQYTFLRVVLQTPGTTPKPALLFETGEMPMKYRVYSKKLTFVNSIKHAKVGANGIIV